ncbi:Oxidoreductase domain protein [Candidatus Sulfopaludibacter sp. SbA3]|nr:Oxidoreductase domain protein [Candidatus Sulfopaludibacter sp. SbA3]
MGLGFMGTTHVMALRGLSGVELAAVYSSDEKKLAGDLTSVHGNLGGGGEWLDFSGLRKYNDLEGVLADPKIDAVDLCLPTYLHESVAVEALRAGKHVLVEKPIALDPYGADRMLNAARRYKRVLMTAQVLRFFPEYIALSSAIANGQLGRWRFAIFRRRCAAPGWGGWLQEPEKSGGGVFDLLIHDVDMCLHLFGKPKAVCASGYSHAALGIDCMAAQLFYADGIAVVTGGWHNAGEYPFSMEYSVTLDGGTVEYSSLGRPPALYGAKGGSQPLELEARDGYAAEIEYFAECCRTGQAPDRCPPGDSADAVKLMCLMLESRKRNGAKMICTL